MKFFIGARDLQGQVFLADIVEAETFGAAYDEATTRCEAEKGRDNFNITAVNEVPDFKCSVLFHDHLDVCQQCGCTDANPCPGGCSWVNDERTLCSKCDQRIIIPG